MRVERRRLRLFKRDDVEVGHLHFLETSHGDIFGANVPPEPRGVEFLTLTHDWERVERPDPYGSGPFERVVQRHRRPLFCVEPVAVAWDAVAFRLSGARDGVACVPRAELTDFLDKLEAGVLDEPIARFLASSPTGRVLRAAAQTGTTGLFDEMESPGAIVPPERVPGRPRPFGRGGRGGSPADARDHKGRRGRGPRRLLVGVGVAVVVIAAGVAVASRGGDNTKVAAVATTGQPTVPPTTTSSATAVPDLLTGVWKVTRTVSDSTNPAQAVGDVSQVVYTITSSCTVSPCTWHLDAPGVGGSSEQADLTLLGGTYAGPISGSSPCIDTVSGAVVGASTITGNVALKLAGAGQPAHFSGFLNITITPGPGCFGTSSTVHSTTFTLDGFS